MEEEEGRMKRSGSDWDLEKFLMPVDEPAAAEGGEIEDGSPSPAASLEGLLLPRAAQKPRVYGGASFADVYCGDLAFEFGDRDAISSHSNGGPLGGNQIWSHNLTSRHSSISATIESQSSICAGSPTSCLKPKGIENQAPGGTSGSEQSDDESLEIEAGLCEQGNDVVEIKRRRRMVSNRESARRSRKRKQAHLADLELQVDQLRGENGTLYKQLTDANQQFSEAVTDNRVLKSDVEALRVKVKMAEDLVARGSLACGLDHLLQSHIGSNQLLNTRHLCRASEVPPATELQADEACYIGAAAGQVQNIRMENSETKNGNIRIRMNQNSPLQSIASLENLENRILSEVTSSGVDIWPWDSHTNGISKHL